MIRYRYSIVEKRSDLRNVFIINIVAQDYDWNTFTERTYLSKEQFVKALPEIFNLIENYGGYGELEDYKQDSSIPHINIPIFRDGFQYYYLEEVYIEYIDKYGICHDVEFWKEDFGECD